MMRLKVLVAGVAGAIGFGIAPQANAAGFFDDFARAFFGRPAAPPIFSDPFETKPRRHKPRPEAAKPNAPAVKLDPATDAFWYLRDPTLRKGDIVVTRSGVVVFDGRTSTEHAPADFTTLGEARRLPKAQKEAIQAAVAAGRSFAAENPPAAPVALAEEARAESAANAQ